MFEVMLYINKREMKAFLQLTQKQAKDIPNIN